MQRVQWLINLRIDGLLLLLRYCSTVFFHQIVLLPRSCEDLLLGAFQHMWRTQFLNVRDALQILPFPPLQPRPRLQSNLQRIHWYRFAFRVHFGVHVQIEGAVLRQSISQIVQILVESFFQSKHFDFLYGWIVHFVLDLDALVVDDISQNETGPQTAPIPIDANANKACCFANWMGIGACHGHDRARVKFGNVNVAPEKMNETSVEKCPKRKIRCALIYLRSTISSRSNFSRTKFRREIVGSGRNSGYIWRYSGGMVKRFFSTPSMTLAFFGSTTLSAVSALALNERFVKSARGR